MHCLQLGILSDQNYVLGAPRLRQIRSRYHAEAQVASRDPRCFAVCRNATLRTCSRAPPLCASRRRNTSPPRCRPLTHCSLSMPATMRRIESGLRIGVEAICLECVGLGCFSLVCSRRLRLARLVRDSLRRQDSSATKAVSVWGRYGLWYDGPGYVHVLPDFTSAKVKPLSPGHRHRRDWLAG